jgi:hypothetical protein
MSERNGRNESKDNSCFHLSFYWHLYRWYIYMFQAVPSIWPVTFFFISVLSTNSVYSWLLFVRYHTWLLSNDDLDRLDSYRCRYDLTLANIIRFEYVISLIPFHVSCVRWAWLMCSYSMKQAMHMNSSRMTRFNIR